MKSLDYEKILRFIMIFAIVGISVLVVVVNFMPAFAYDFYDLYPGTEHGRSNFITYPSVLYLFAIYNCFMYLGSNDLKYIDSIYSSLYSYEHYEDNINFYKWIACNAIHSTCISA